MPAPARIAADSPPSAARPAWNRFVIAPSWMKAQVPEAQLAAMPSADSVARASRPRMRAAAAAAPNAPQVPVECQPAALCGLYPPNASSTRRPTS